ncbi:Atp-dependent zinc metalloprotease ftsh [Thalictrum thalictroides]|uniref:Atp-dependent zinc metalloprotease ftsh n=1 Tax=Thalictrum thalictroides TaxID=46969 RepID=A0A7J6VFA3_THATH|nr:Atp-dependent zinc metalloprotease ftsh [Thalictrum thalictroides]
MEEEEAAAVRRRHVNEYTKKLLNHKELDSRVRKRREDFRAVKKEYAKTEDDLKALQSVGQIIGEVLRPLDNERLIVKASSGPRYVVGCRSKVDKEKLTAGTRVVLDMTTLTIMRPLPREVDPVVYNMLHEDPGNVSYSAVGGLSDQIRELRESIELPLMNPELFLRVGIKPPKTLLARAIASNIDANFLKVVSSAIIDKYIGESARLIREMFGYARDHQPCIIFMDEIDAIGGRRFSEGTSADREIQRTLMELLNQLDGFDQLGKVKMIMATNRPDVLDPALLRPGRLDRKIEIPLPNEQSRMEILKIHAAGVAKLGEIDYEAVVKLAEGFNGADLRNVCTEAGMFAIRAERDYVIQEDFMKGVLLYGPPGTGKTLLARAIASNIDANFLKVVSSAIIDKYIGESARLIREMFGYARDHQPCIIFMDEIDAIGGRRFSEGTSADREIQRTLMELLNQLDGFDQLGKVKMIMATNRPDVLDPALLRPGRLDRKIEIPLPNEQSRMEILKIHAAGVAKLGEIDYEAVVKLAEGFNGADLRNVCTEAGMFAIRAERDYVIQEDFMKAVRKLNEAKKLESSSHYNADFGKD